MISLEICTDLYSTVQYSTVQRCLLTFVLFQRLRAMAVVVVMVLGAITGAPLILLGIAKQSIDQSINLKSVRDLAQLSADPSDCTV